MKTVEMTVKAKEHKGASILHTMVGHILAGADIAICDSENSMISLTRGEYGHYHLFAGTVEDGQKIRSFKIDFRMSGYIGKVIDQYIN